MKIKNLKGRNLKVLVERLIPFESLVDVRYGNVLCPFHPNRNTPSAKFYHDEDGIIRLNCFSEHRQFTSYDYIKLVLDQDPLKYLQSEYTSKELEDIIKIAEDSNAFDFYRDTEKIDEIHNIFIDVEEDINNFLDKIYSGFSLKELKETKQ